MKILHFDINGTLIPQDKANKKDILDGLISSLADEVYTSGNISYKEYTESIYPGTDPIMKEQRMKIYHSDMMKSLSDKYMDRLNIALLHTELMYRDDTIISLVPSFVQCVLSLKEKDEPFRLHLRTFGHDMHDILPLVESLIGPMRIIDTRREYIPHKDLRYIFRHENCAVIDDYKPWVESQKDWRQGKVFPVENSHDPSTDEGYISYFFDDNVQNDIVCPIVDEEPVHPSIFKGRNIYQVSILDALNDINYFLDRI